MANLRAAIEDAGTALLSVGTGLPVGDLVNYTRALFGQHGPADVKSLARSVERELTGWIDTEYGGAAAIEPALATLDDLLASHALGLHAVVQQHGMNEASVAAAIMTDGERSLAGLGQADRSLVEQLIERIYRRYLAQPELLPELSDVALRYLLAQQAMDRAEFDRRLRALEGLTIPKPPPFSIPQPVIDFKGYDAEIAAVQAALEGGSASISAVQGIGGVGKTELAREVARRMRANFPDGQILVDMLGTTQPRDARDAMTAVLKALGQEEVDPNSLVADYHAALDGRRVLVLLDNLGVAEQVESLIPRPPAALLVTSRDELVLPGVELVVLEKLARPAAVALLQELARGLGDADADALAELCCDLPLALRVAGSDPLVRRGSVANYLEALRARRLEHLSRSAQRARRSDRDPMVVLGYSYERLAESDPDLARAFTLLGVFPADFDLAGAAAVLGVPTDEAEETLILLAGRSLLQEPVPGRWRLHDLLRDLAETRAEASTLVGAAKRHSEYFLEALGWCADAYTNRKEQFAEAIGHFQRDLSNFEPAIAAAERQNNSPKAAAAHLGLGLLLAAIGRDEAALTNTKKAVALYRSFAETGTDASRESLAVSLSNLSKQLVAIGSHKEALAAAKEAVDLYTRLQDARPGASLRDFARSLNNLIVNLNDTGGYQDALAVSERAVAICRTLVETDSDLFLPELATSLLNFGLNLGNIGRYGDALVATEEAVSHFHDLGEATPDRFLPDLAKSLMNQGTMLKGLGRYQDALAASEQAVGLCRALAGTRTENLLPDLAMSLVNLGRDLRNLGRYGDALVATEEAVSHFHDLAEATPDRFLPDLAKSLMNQGTMLNDLGRYQDALAASERAVAFCRALVETNRDLFLPELGMSLLNTGLNLSNLGRYGDALVATEEAVSHFHGLAEATPDRFLPDLSKGLWNLGAMLNGLGRYQDALATTERANTHYRFLVGTRPGVFELELASSYYNLGLIQNSLGRRRDALAAAEEAVAIFRRIATERPSAVLPDLARSVLNLGTIQSAVGRREDAFATTEEAVDLYRRLAEVQPDAFSQQLAKSLFNLSLFLDALERAGEAHVANSEAIELLRPAFLQLPQSVLQWIQPMCGLYLQRCQKLGVEPDMALLGPIVEVFERLQSESGESAPVGER